MELTSMQNPLVQQLRSLKTAKGRAEHGLILVEGEKMIREAQSCGLTMRDLLVEQGRDCAIECPPGADMHSAPRRILEAVCDTVTPGAVCASFVPPMPLDLQAPPDLLVALDGLQDPGNVGTIWRTLDAAGYGGLILGPGSAAPMAPKVVRGSMGSCFRVPALSVDDLPAALQLLKARGHQIAATALTGQDIYRRAPLGKKLALVIGSEARGVSEDVLALSDALLKLPMRGGAESLNAAVAAGIVLYELTRGT